MAKHRQAEEKVPPLSKVQTSLIVVHAWLAIYITRLLSLFAPQYQEKDDFYQSIMWLRERTSRMRIRVDS